MRALSFFGVILGTALSILQMVVTVMRRLTVSCGLFFICYSIINVLVDGDAHAKSRGEQMYRLCASCHGTDGQGNADLQTPAIAGMEAWYVERQLHNFRKGGRGLHPSDLPGMRMRPMAKSIPTENDVKVVSEFVAAMEPAKLETTVHGSLVKGEKTYTICAACHGPQAKGNKELNAPSLRETNDWYLLTQMQHFKSGVRGSRIDVDPIGATMRPNAQMLDEQGMKDVIAYIQALKE